MVDPMHIWRDNEKSHPLVDTTGKPDVSVVEHARRVQKDLKDDDGDGIYSQKNDGRHLNTHGENDFNGMETDSGSDIKIKVRMVYPVKTPKGGDEMKHGMLKVDNEIK